jgi:hypothetical protein
MVICPPPVHIEQPSPSYRRNKCTTATSMIYDDSADFSAKSYDQNSAVSYDRNFAVNNYERGKLRPHPEMVVRLAKALRVSTDEMLGVRPASSNGAAVSRRVLRRLQAIDQLPKRDQDALFRTIDAFLQARRAS